MYYLAYHLPLLYDSIELGSSLELVWNVVPKMLTVYLVHGIYTLNTEVKLYIQFNMLN